jgi:hypothetical protein
VPIARPVLYKAPPSNIPPPKAAPSTPSTSATPTPVAVAAYDPWEDGPGTVVPMAMPSPTSSASTSAVLLPRGWYQYLTPQGITYYANPTSGETQWLPPPVPHFDPPPPAYVTPPAVHGAPAQGTFTPTWMSDMHTAIAQAYAEQMTPSEHSVLPAWNRRWFCHYCAGNVDEGRLVDHLGSNGHRKNRQNSITSMALEQMQQSGALPYYIIVRDGYKYCLLCSMWACDNHLLSKKHLRNVTWDIGNLNSTARSSWDIPPAALHPTPPAAAVFPLWSHILGMEEVAEPIVTPIVTSNSTLEIWDQMIQQEDTVQASPFSQPAAMDDNPVPLLTYEDASQVTIATQAAPGPLLDLENASQVTVASQAAPGPLLDLEVASQVTVASQAAPGPCLDLEVASQVTEPTPSLSQTLGDGRWLRGRRPAGRATPTEETTPIDAPGYTIATSPRPRMSPTRSDPEDAQTHVDTTAPEEEDIGPTQIWGDSGDPALWARDGANLGAEPEQEPAQASGAHGDVSPTLPFALEIVEPTPPPASSGDDHHGQPGYDDYDPRFAITSDEYWSLSGPGAGWLLRHEEWETPDHPRDGSSTEGTPTRRKRVRTSSAEAIAAPSPATSSVSTQTTITMSIGEGLQAFGIVQIDNTAETAAQELADVPEDEVADEEYTDLGDN